MQRLRKKSIRNCWRGFSLRSERGNAHGPFAGAVRPRTLLRGFRSPCNPAPEDFILWTPVCEDCWICKNRFFRMKLGERKNCFHGHNKTKATAGNRASTFLQQPFVFPSASHPVGGINAALPVGVYPTCAVKELFPTCSEICFAALPKSFPFQEQPFRDATRKATTLQKAGACASEAQGMRETRNKPLVGL